MPKNSPEGRLVRFGVFEADLRSGELRKGGVKIRLREQAFQLLSELLERPGEVVTREELRGRLWPDGTFVDFDHSLNAAVNRIREVLGDSAASPRFVETLPRRGYRFIAPVEKLGESVLGPLDGAESRPPQTQPASEHESAAVEADESESSEPHPTSGADPVSEPRPASDARPVSEPTPPNEPGKPKRHIHPVYVGMAGAVLALIAVAVYLGTISRYGTTITPSPARANSEFS